MKRHLLEAETPPENPAFTPVLTRKLKNVELKALTGLKPSNPYHAQILRACLSLNQAFGVEEAPFKPVAAAVLWQMIRKKRGASFQDAWMQKGIIKAISKGQLISKLEDDGVNTVYLLTEDGRQAAGLKVVGDPKGPKKKKKKNTVTAPPRRNRKRRAAPAAAQQEAPPVRVNLRAALNTGGRMTRSQTAAAAADAGIE